jgi:predicted DNA-binding mobile mystery protein A
MKSPRITAQSRARLDERLARLEPVERYRPPARGWIRAIREALGMTTAQMARRLGVSQPSIVGLEQSEEKETIQLASLRRSAEALDCTLVYVLVPNKPLGVTVRERARALLLRRRQPVEHTMLLEDQQVNDSITDAQVEDAIRDTSPRAFWD